MPPAYTLHAYPPARRYMGSVIIGATTLEQLAENIDACCAPLDEGTEAAIDELYLKHQNPNLQD